MYLLISGTTMEWADSWLNYPGLEAWKFINLAIFITAGILILRRPLREALLSRRDRIRLQLTEAEREREQAQALLKEAEAMLARLDLDAAAVRENAKKEAEAERVRLANLTEKEIEKIRLQGQREIDTATKVAMKELQKFLAHRSVDLARETVRSQIRPEDDARLITEGVGELRRRRA
ncbi:MAG TPA: ATP synthase F0 subunit B [Pyrinomonadaceae bacterium]